MCAKTSLSPANLFLKHGEPGCLSEISDNNLPKLEVWDLRMDTLNFILPIKVRQPRTKLWHLVDILSFKCHLDLKGLVSGMSLSPTDNVSDHYNDNQASQNSCDNDWD